MKWPSHHVNAIRNQKVIPVWNSRRCEFSHVRTLYGLPKMLGNERSRQSTTVLDKNRNLVSSKSEVKARWTEHFKKLLNREKPANLITSDQECDVHSHGPWPWHGRRDDSKRTNTWRSQAAIKGLQDGKAPRIDSTDSTYWKQTYNMAVWEDPEKLETRAHHRTSKERKYETKQ